MHTPLSVRASGLILCVFLLAAFESEASKKDLHFHLERELPGDILEKEFLEIKEYVDRDPTDPLLWKPGLIPAHPPQPKIFVYPPLGDHFEINGKKIKTQDRKELFKFFKEKTLVGVPVPQTDQEEERIQTTYNEDHRTVWIYPPGTQVAHLIELRTKPAQAFELRIVKKLTDGTWGFGVYAPRDPQKMGSPFQLLSKYLPALEKQKTEPGEWPADQFKPEKFKFIREDGLPVTVSMTRTRTSACQACHRAMSPNAYQYQVISAEGEIIELASRKNTGPCGFGPTNKSVDGWLVEYLKKYGKNPFVKRSDTGS